MKEKRATTRSAEPSPPRAGPIAYTANDIAIAVLPWEKKVEFGSQRSVAALVGEDAA